MVSARELHRFLGSRQEFANWIKNRIADYGFQEGEDFCLTNLSSKNGSGGHNAKEYTINLDMAKELCMLERSEVGRSTRRYFIEVERLARSLNTHQGDYARLVSLLRLGVERMGSQNKLAERLGISSSSISDMLYGRWHRTSADAREALDFRLQVLIKEGMERTVQQSENELLRIVVQIPKARTRNELMKWWSATTERTDLDLFTTKAPQLQS